MAVAKSAARMDYWREYFGSANASIFEIIEGAIMMAASDYPKEFRVRRDGIAQTLFSCRLIKCSGCDKEELAFPVDDDAGDDDDDDDDADNDAGNEVDEDEDDEGRVNYKSKITDVDVNGSKESSKVINCSRNDDDEEEDDDDDDDHHHDVEVNESKHHVSNYSYGDAEALTNEIEEESKMFDEVMRIKEIVDNSQDESAYNLCNSLRKLQLMHLTVEILKATEVGKSVNVLRKHSSKDVRQIATTLIEGWKVMVDEWVNATTKLTVSEATPESMNPSVLDEEDGLPSPPLEDLAFLNPHSMSLELSEFFDGMDDYGNPRKSGESNKNRNNNEKPPVEKQNVTKWKQQKPLNGPTMVRKEDRDSNVMKQPTSLKPTRPPLANLAPRIKPTDRKLQNPEKPTVPKRPMAPQQRKPLPLERESVQEKLEATKRKLQERYQQAEKAKRQRTIQVMELHDLPKQNVAPKNQQSRPGNNHNRHWAAAAHGRC